MHSHFYIVTLQIIDMVREMIGGCCVCLDERGWNENPLVYCDGNGCTIAVHQGSSMFILDIVFLKI